MKLNNKKLIQLDKFINHALYKKNGYYMKKNPFGKKGDFVTSPNISILFSEMITVWIIAFWQNLKKPKKFNLVELGSGNAEMIYQIIKTSSKFPLFKKSCSFYIYEKSPYLKKIQKKKLKYFNVKWIKNLYQIKKAPTLFIGNEFFDAMPVKQFIKKKNKWFEKYIALTKKNKKILDVKTNIKKFEKKIGISISKKQRFLEISPDAIKMLKIISKLIFKFNGGLLIIDYGYYKKKMLNTLQAIKNHKKTNILDNEGEVDISHMINFKFIEKVVSKFKLKLVGISSQRNFLTRLGILERAEILAKNLPFSKKADIYYRLKRLIDRTQMGELFKVMFVAKKEMGFKIGFEDDQIKKTN